MNTKDLQLGRLAHLLSMLAISALLLTVGAIPALAAGQGAHVQPATMTSDSGVTEKSAGPVALNGGDDEDEDEDEDTRRKSGGGGGGGGLPATDTVGPATVATTTSDSVVVEKSAGAVALNGGDDDDEEDEEDTRRKSGGGGGGGGLPATDTVGASSTETGGVSPLSLGALAIAGVIAGAMTWNRKRVSEESGS